MMPERRTASSAVVPSGTLRLINFCFFARGVYHFDVNILAHTGLTIKFVGALNKGIDKGGGNLVEHRADHRLERAI